MLDRIEAIHDAAVAEIESAGTAAALEELRVKHLGRKAELPNLLRGVAQLPPEERGAVGKRANEVRRELDALNHDPAHPARSRSDTFYIDEGTVLRTHTSPMQIRAMEQWPPPLAIIVPGRVYRPDSDATHTPQFTQIEGLCVDEDITLADLKGVLLAFARAIFGVDREIRLRPHFFPFTEPSVEVDVSCFACARDGSPCRLCKGSGWIEILGSGMVDPNVFGYVRHHGYDPET